MKPILTTMIYCLQANNVLLMFRNKEPNMGLWVGPGGKLEPNESPCECACRELYEETRIRPHRLHFRGLVTEISPRADWQWMLFLYVVTEMSGDMVGDEREGHLRWWSLTEALQLPIPQADKIFFPKVIELSQPFYQAKYLYDADLKLIEVIDESGYDDSGTIC